MREIAIDPAAMEPLMPRAERGRLAELSFEILQESGRLAGLVRSPWVFQEVAAVVRGMNCYYSNLIEGHRTSPRDIARAMAGSFCSPSPKGVLRVAFPEGMREALFPKFSHPDLYPSSCESRGNRMIPV